MKKHGKWICFSLAAALAVTTFLFEPAKAATQSASTSATVKKESNKNQATEAEKNGTAAKEKTTEAKKAYQQFLKQHENTASLSHFAIVMINGYDLPVLLTSEEVWKYRSNKQSNDWCYYIYQDGKVKKTGKDSAGRGLSISEGYLISVTYDGIELISMNQKGKAKNKTAYSYSQADDQYFETTPASSKNGKTWQDKEITKEQFKTYYQKYFTDGKAVKFQKNTVKNRNKILK